MELQRDAATGARKRRLARVNDVWVSEHQTCGITSITGTMYVFHLCQTNTAPLKPFKPLTSNL